MERSPWFGADVMKRVGLHNRTSAKGDGKSVEDEYSWGPPVLPPFDGVVGSFDRGKKDNRGGRSCPSL